MIERYEYRGSPTAGQLADLQDTGVSNGRMLPGRAAQYGAWLAVAAVVLLPLFM